MCDDIDVDEAVKERYEKRYQKMLDTEFKEAEESGWKDGSSKPV